MTFINRKLLSYLREWQEKKDRKPLLLRGARQVGKSLSISKWCEDQSFDLITINFEEYPQLISLFEQDFNVERIINEITLIKGQSPKDANAVLFFDEIQKAPKAITALRYFYEKAPDVKVVAAGSLVEFVLKEQGLPVGRVESLFVYPFSFSEFLAAVGEDVLASFVEGFDFKEISPLAHNKILTYLRTYFIVGGMPKAVSRYIETKDLSEVGKEQAIILQGYRDDFRKYAKSVDWFLLETIFEKMGELAGGGAIKFSSINREAKSIQVRRALLALEAALVVHKILPTNTDKLPLGVHSVDKKFKLAFLDIGLLHHILGFDWSRVSSDVDLTNVARGRFAEQFVAQELVCSRSNLSRYNLFYWNRPVAGSEAEVDFLIEHNNRIAPIEVKSGPRGKLKSLDLFIKEKNPEIAFVLSQRNFRRKDSFIFLPLYLASRL